MAVTSFREIHDGREGSGQITNRKMVRRYTRVFRAETNDPHDDAVTVLNAAGAPLPGSVYPYDTSAWCQGGKAVSPHKKVWICTFSYSSEREMKEDPNADPPQFSWSTQQFQKSYTKDNAGKAIVNSAGDPFDPPVEGDDSRWSCTVTRNVPSVPSWILDYKDAVNSAAFTIDGISVNKGAAKLQSITIGPAATRNDVIYRPLALTITFAETFAAEVLDAGFRYKDDGTITKVPNDPVAPVPLDGSGGILENPTEDNAVILEFDIYPEKDFSALPLT